MSLFKALKSTKEFLWTDECEKDLTELKEYLSNPPLISILEPYEQLYVYLASFDQAISATLIRKYENVQKPIYYISKCLVG